MSIARRTTYDIVQSIEKERSLERSKGSGRTARKMPKAKIKTLKDEKLYSNISKLFDPMGLVSPCIILIKILIQKLWSLNLTWDERVPADLEQIWLKFKDNLVSLNQLKVTRHVVCKNATIVEIHGFCDALRNCLMYIAKYKLYIKDMTKKTDKTVGRFSENVMREAVNLVTTGMTIQQAAREKNLSFKTLRRYVKQYKDDPIIKTPEGCSLARAAGFNKVNKEAFFTKLETVLQRQNPKSKVEKKAHSLQLVAFHILAGVPCGTLGLATKAGWMNTECFVEVLCKDNCIIVLTMPPHCKNSRRKGKTMIATDTPEKTEIENNRMKKAKTAKRNIMAEHTESNDADIESQEEVGDTYSLHDSDTSVGTEAFSDSN
ncbi:hypothetical protein ILUMI_24857 [Ignelater luminosus]|uniref:HTH psq-type domain-containing protein n=1 Tax=Ignelater luminosus TaxID=2038154 RepID=A0A8K0CBP5_IGNLU|nr:hypothetical protein ILUMI_24857 [Ignelater luminosus]